MKAYLTEIQYGKPMISPLDEIPAHWIFTFQIHRAERISDTDIILFEGKDDEQIQKIMNDKERQFDISINAL
jgi:translation elongation factor EF-G